MSDQALQIAAELLDPPMTMREYLAALSDEELAELEREVIAAEGRQP